MQEMLPAVPKIEKQQTERERERDNIYDFQLVIGYESEMKDDSYQCGQI